MNIQLTDLGMQILFALCTGASIYAGIKSSLTLALERSTTAIKIGSDAHGRIDAHIDKHHAK